MATALHPILTWSQNKNDITIKIDVRDLKGEKIIIEEKHLSINYSEGQKNYAQEIDLSSEVDTEKSKYTVSGFCTTILLVKKTSGVFWKSLSTNDKAMKNLKVDWSEYQDSDDEKPADDNDMMKKFAGMPGLGGMGGMGGMGGFPGMGGMGGFPGMEGLGGMGGFGGEGEGDDDSDDDAEPKADLGDLEGTPETKEGA